MRRRGRPEKYPWDEWLDGEDKIIMRGVHVDHIDGTHYPKDARPENLRRLIRLKARQREVSVAVEAYGHDGDIALRFGVLGNGRYDWDTLFDGDVHYLSLRDEISSTMASFRTIASRVAKSRGHSATINQRGEIVAIRAVFDDGRAWRRASEPDDAVVAASAKAAAEEVVMALDGTRDPDAPSYIVTGPRPTYDPLEED